MSSPTGAPPSDIEGLLLRLSELAAAPVDSVAPSGDAAMIALFRDDILEALRAARCQSRDLARELAVDPAPLLDGDFQARIQPSPQEEARSAGRWKHRAETARALARVDDLAGRLYPVLLALDRRLGTG